MGGEKSLLEKPICPHSHTVSAAMAKTSSALCTPQRPLPAHLILLAAISLLLAHDLSRHSSLAATADFEGFDSDDLEFDDDAPSPLLLHPLPPPLATTITTDPHTAPPPPPPPPPDLDDNDLPLFWDEDEFEGIPLLSSDPVPSPQSPLSTLDPPPEASPRLSLKSYPIEIAAITFLIAFIANYFLGRRQNEQLALAWVERFAAKNAVLDKNFSLLGDGVDNPLLLKEAQDAFKFYARGRRHCKGLLAGIELVGRHDLIARAFQLVVVRRDMITFEVLMNEDAMDHVVLALVRRGAAKGVQKEARDLQRFASVVGSAPAGRRWVAEDLVVIAESKEVAGDMITNVVLDQVFGESVFDKLGKWFISLHFSDQHPGSHKKMLIFKFALPDATNMADMTRLVTLVPYYIDLVGRYKLSSQARSKTEAARAKAAQDAYKDLQNARQELLQKRKADRKKLIEEAEAKLIAEAIRKKR